jgi:RimJ/RimL family protein N-acetyltransferase
MIDFGENVTLHRIETKDLGQLQKWRNMPEIYDWCRQDNLISDIDQIAWYEKQAKDPTIWMFTIKPKEKNAGIVGVCGLTDVNQVHKRAEFSIYIGPEYQGKGYAKAALKTLFRFGFEWHNFNIIWGETFQSNPAARMFEKLGMKKEGTRRNFYYKKGHYIDCHLYSIKRHELKT